MLENGVFNRPYVRDITKICECACSMNCDKNATELRPDRNPDIITNADRIRDMSDEELSEFISRIEIGDFGQQVYGKTFCDMCKGQYECDDCRLWWLQQPCEGGHLMDYDKLIEHLRECGTYGFKQEECRDAATALSTLQAENKRLNKIVCSIPTTPDSGRTVSQYDKEMSMCAYLDDLEAENEKLRAELEQVIAALRREQDG